MALTLRTNGRKAAVQTGYNPLKGTVGSGDPTQLTDTVVGLLQNEVLVGALLVIKTGPQQSDDAASYLGYITADQNSYGVISNNTVTWDIPGAVSELARAQELVCSVKLYTRIGNSGPVLPWLVAVGSFRSVDDYTLFSPDGVIVSVLDHAILTVPANPTVGVAATLTSLGETADDTPITTGLTKVYSSLDTNKATVAGDQVSYLLAQPVGLRVTITQGSGPGAIVKTNDVTVTPVAAAGPPANTPAGLLYRLSAIGYDTNKIRGYAAKTGLGDFAARSGKPALTAVGVVPVVGSGNTAAWSFDTTNRLTSGDDAAFDLSVVDGALFVVGSFTGGSLASIQRSDNYLASGFYMTGGAGASGVVTSIRCATAHDGNQEHLFLDENYPADTLNRCRIVQSYSGKFWTDAIAPSVPYALPQQEFHISTFDPGVYSLNIGQAVGGGPGGSGTVQFVGWFPDLPHAGVEIVYDYLASTTTFVPANTQLKGVSVIGDSISRYYGSSDQAHAWQSIMLATPQLAGYIEQNQACPQREIFELAKDVRGIGALLPAKLTSPHLGSLMMGTNDLFLWYPRADATELTTSTETVLSAWLGTSPLAHMVWIPMPDRYFEADTTTINTRATVEANVRAWIAADSDRAARIKVPDTSGAPWLTGTMNSAHVPQYTVDDTHPNDAGHQLIADRVTPLAVSLV